MTVFVLLFPKIGNLENATTQFEQPLLVGQVWGEAAVPSGVEVLQVEATLTLDLGGDGRVDDSVAALKRTLVYYPTKIFLLLLKVSH